MKKTNRKRIMILAAVVLLLLIGSVSAYFTSTDEAKNTWTVGKVEIDLQEPLYDENNPEESQNMAPNKVVHKDPKVENTGENDAFVFLKVSIPKANVAVASQDGSKQDSVLQELFDYGISSDWVKVEEDTSAVDKNTYVYAYGNADECTALTKGGVTSVLFKNTEAADAAEPGAVGKISFKNVIEGQGLEAVTLEIPVEAYAIQTTDLTSDNVKSPSEVWNILSKQSVENAVND